MWLREIPQAGRRALLAHTLGWGIDGFDYMAYSFVIPTLLVVFRIDTAQAGSIATGALIASAAGGWAAGVLADRFGRVRILALTVLWFAVFTALSGCTRSYTELLITRTLQGLGFGGEWAVGSVLVAESIDARHRGKAVGLAQSSWTFGWAAAAAGWATLAALIAPAHAWRLLFWLGLPPAVAIAAYARFAVPETLLRPAQCAAHNPARPGDPPGIFARPLRRTTLLAGLLCCGMQGAYYAVTTWLPTYLERERHLAVLGRTSYLLVLIGGSLAGYLTGAWATDALGRRRCFIAFALLGALLVVTYMRAPMTDRAMLVLGFPLGFCVSGIFSGSGAFLAELFPSAVRGSGQGFCYSSGRAVGALCPMLIGVWSLHGSLGGAIGTLAALGYGLVIVAALLLPETQGRALAAAVPT